MNYNLNILNPQLEISLKILSELRGLKFVTAIVLMFKNIQSKDKTKFDIFYSSLNVEIIINENDIENVSKSVYTIITSNKQKSLGKGSGWINDSVIDDIVRISKYNLLARSSYIEIPKELDHQRKELINL